MMVPDVHPTREELLVEIDDAFAVIDETRVDDEILQSPERARAFARARAAAKLLGAIDVVDRRAVETLERPTSGEGQ